MSDYTDPTQRALEKARERGLIVTDEPSGLSPSNPDPFNNPRPRIPIAYNANPRMQRDQAFPYQPLTGPDTTSLHAALSPEKQAEYAEQMLKQKIEQDNARFMREMQNEDHKVSRSRMLLFTLLKIAKWITIIFVFCFVGLVVVLGVTGWKAGSLSDTTLLNTIVNFFGTLLGAFVSNSGL